MATIEQVHQQFGNAAKGTQLLERISATCQPRSDRLNRSSGTRFAYVVAPRTAAPTGGGSAMEPLAPDGRRLPISRGSCDLLGQGSSPDA